MADEANASKKYANGKLFGLNTDVITCYLVLKT